MKTITKSSNWITLHCPDAYDEGINNPCFFRKEYIMGVEHYIGPILLRDKKTNQPLPVSRPVIGSLIHCGGQATMRITIESPEEIMEMINS